MKEVKRYQCETCEQSWTRKEDAERCEAHHVYNKDKLKLLEIVTISDHGLSRDVDGLIMAQRMPTTIRIRNKLDSTGNIETYKIVEDRS